MARRLKYTILLAALLAGTSIGTQAQTYVPVFDTIHFTTGGNFGQSDVADSSDSQDAAIEWRSQSGVGDSNGLVNIFLNDSRTVQIQYWDFGGGQNWPVIGLGGQTPYGFDYMTIQLGTWWPNDNNFHTAYVRVLQAGGSAYGLPYTPAVFASIDGNSVPASITHMPQDIVLFNMHHGGNYYTGYNSLVGIDKVYVAEGVEILYQNSPVLLQGDMITNDGWGNNFIWLPDANVSIEIDQCGPGC